MNNIVDIKTGATPEVKDLTPRDVTGALAQAAPNVEPDQQFNYYISALDHAMQTLSEIDFEVFLDQLDEAVQMEELSKMEIMQLRSVRKLASKARTLIHASHG